MSTDIKFEEQRKLDQALQSLAEGIKSGQLKRIVVLTGAGISTAAGIPDFRSPGTGLYDKLAPLKLPHPESIFSIAYFRHTPEPFYAIAKAHHPANLKPTITHAFLALLTRKGYLHFLFTQNIDGLESDAGVPDEKMIATHGSWKDQHCIQCKAAYPTELMKKAVQEGEVPYCVVDGCGGVVKPDVVFFGEELPDAFFQKQHVVEEADLVLFMGTSLKVAPCSQIPWKIWPGIPRVLINLEQSGGIGGRQEDVCILGTCDDGVRKFATVLGWEAELESIWNEALGTKSGEAQLGEGASLDECIEKFVSQMDANSQIQPGHKRMLENHLSGKLAEIMVRRGHPE